MALDVREVAFFSQAWADEVKERFNAPPVPEYRATKLELYWEWIARARATFNGSVALGVTGLPGHADPINVLLTFEQGRCRQVSLVGGKDSPRPTYALEATYHDWKKIMAGYDVSRALMQRKLKLASGDPYEFYKLVFFFTEALAAIAQIPTTFPEDQEAA